MRFNEFITEAANPAQQAAIAIAIAKKKKQGVAEGSRKSITPEQMIRDAVEAYKQEAAKENPNTYILDSIKSNINDIKREIERNKQGVAEGENWSKHNHKRVGGMSDKSVKSYRRSHPGSKIQTAVTTKPSKIKKGSKDSKRRASFCARMRGMKKHNTSAKTAHDPDSNINKSLRRWHCESVEQLEQLVMLAEQKIRNLKK